MSNAKSRSAKPAAKPPVTAAAKAPARSASPRAAKTGGKPAAESRRVAQGATLERRLELAEAHLAAIGRLRAFVEIGTDRKLREANDNFVSALGYSREELRTMSHDQLVPAAHAGSAEYREHWSALAAGKAQAGHFRLVAKDGREIWFQANYNPVVDRAGQVVSIATYATDITQMKLDKADVDGQIAAISKAQAVAEFALDGRLLSANTNFQTMFGYGAADLAGKLHDRFVDQEPAAVREAGALWDKLRRGEYDAGRYQRVASDGRLIWIQSSYNPILDTDGKPFKIVQYATDITAARLKSADNEGQIAAISKAQAVIEFSLDGLVLDANANFLDALGYRLDEIKGQHHSLFVDPVYRSSPEYRAFWDKLGRGEYDAGQYKRIGKGGREVWIQASYNPILDGRGKPFKVVKYATDITAQVRAQQAMQAAVEQTQHVVEAAKEGDLMQRIPLDGKDGAVRELCVGVNSLVDTMASVVGQIAGATGTITTAAREIASGNSDLSARTEQQAASLEETASSMEELTSTVKQNAENARQANQLAQGAANVAVRGGDVVGQVVTTMAAINDSSKKIVDIISVIDGIAFQTNILALNAAVEAARAGEQGRGFAVVAAEVRSLAQRSAGAAKEIKALIGDSVEKVGNGTRLVEHAGKTMDEIVTSVKRVTDIMAEISAASQEQSQGIEQVNQAITQMDEVTQQNAALVEQASAAARSLEEQATGLAEAVERFRVEASAQAAERPAAERVAAVRPSTSHLLKSPARPAPRPAVRGTAATPARPVRKPATPAGDGGQWSEF